MKKYLTIHCKSRVGILILVLVYMYFFLHWYSWKSTWLYIVNLELEYSYSYLCTSFCTRTHENVLNYMYKSAGNYHRCARPLIQQIKSNLLHGNHHPGKGNNRPCRETSYNALARYINLAIKFSYSTCEHCRSLSPPIPLGDMANWG